MSAKYETMADKILTVSSFEDMLFRMNGINVSNIFGDGGEVIS
jgi:vacuolar protein sorting-associated protein 13A/C